MDNKSNQNQGFLLISVILALAIILIWAAIYFGKSGGGAQSTKQTGNKAIEQTKENNSLLLQENLETQNQLNSIGQ